MQRNKIIKLIAINASIVLVNIFVFSNFLPVSIMVKALRVTIPLMSVIGFCYFNGSILFGKEDTVVKLNDIKTSQDYITALKKNMAKTVFSENIKLVLNQMEHLDGKKDVIKDILLQIFNETEMSYTRFEGVVSEAEKLFYLNVKSILNKLNAFDNEDYLNLLNGKIPQGLDQNLIDEKMNIYNEYIRFVKKSVQSNEELLIKLDKLLLEISKLESFDDTTLSNMAAMRELDELIGKIKYYK